MVACNFWKTNLHVHPPKLHLLPLIIFLFFFSPILITSTTAAQSSFNFPSFNRSLDTEIILSGDATFSTTDDIQLTVNRNDIGMAGSSGRATYFEPMQLWDKATGKLAEFTTNFSFVIDSLNKSLYADGMAFFLAPDSFEFSNEGGGGLGLASSDPNKTSSNSSNPFVAVEFDTYQNRRDQPGDHVGNITSQQTLCHAVNLTDTLPEWVTFGFTAATGTDFEIHSIRSWSFSTNLRLGRPGRNRANRTGMLVGLVVGAGVLAGGLGLLWFLSWKKRERVGKRNDSEFNLSYEFENEAGPKKFSYTELTVATKNFAEEEKLGEGGFGEVYRGFLKDLNSYVAVKRVSKGSKQGIKEYAAEVKIISRLRHRNLVQLMGWCHEERQLLLVYEFMPNDSLYSHLFKENSLLTWVMRYNIARGLASALLYLHEEWEQCVLHRDIKSSNIMLDANFNAKLGDFGLARLVDHGKGSQTTIVAGTRGYMDPKYLMTDKASKESDVYSFGIVALEIACGMEPIKFLPGEGQIRMVDWVWELYGMGNLLKAADPKLCSEFDEEQMQCLMIVGLWCACPDYKLRPSIKQAIQVLNFEAPLPNLPSKMPLPTYFSPPENMPAFSISSSYVVTGSEGGQTQSSSFSYNTNSSASTSSALLSYPQ
ncbi:hypothetical protein F0562_028844 [Nyssa sinensis]|uniref:non-specific serine/threonine protein kinase n=1 Tax=Nyssa sinensis TaxID=561372 RepID=A0A5J5B2B4_9ASTE|nr:hypothetical protein F0562_028844 [Nyssa sinensis]